MTLRFHSTPLQEASVSHIRRMMGESPDVLFRLLEEMTRLHSSNRRLTEVLQDIAWHASPAKAKAIARAALDQESQP